MPGTILLDDLRSSIGDELRSHAQGLLQLGQGAVQSINDAVTPPPVPQGPDPNQILQELQQHAQQAAAAAQPALQVLGNAGQAASGAVTQLGQARDQVNQQLQDHVASITQGAQDAVQSLATPPPQPPPQTTPVLGGPPPTDMGPATVGQGQSAFITSLQGMAQRAAAATGIDPNAMLAIAANETGWGQSSNAQQQNNLFSLQGDGSNGSRWASYKSPQESFNAFINLVQTAPRYAQAWADRGNASKFVDDLRNAGYVVDEPGYPAQGWVDQVKSIYDHLPPAAQGAVNAVQGAGQQVLGAARGALDTASTAMNQSQFNDPQLTADESYAACGPAAAVRFAERFGRNPTLREATDLAKQVGWTSGGGMAGITSEQRLLKNMGVDTHIVAPDWDAIAKEATTGNPVTISTPGHYFFADGYNPQTGAFHVGRSGLDLVHGSEWMTPTQMENLMGRAQGALFADNPAVPASSTAPASLGGGAGASNAPITMGAYQSAKAPLVVGDQTSQAPTPIQTAQDVLGGAAGAVGEAVGGAASALGSAAQGALAQATAPVQLQPGQVSARDQVGQVAADVQQAAQGVLGAAQDVNRMTPGTTAVNAVAPVLGAAASDLGTAARGAVDTTVPVLGAAASDLGTQGEAFARSPIGQRLLQAAAENAQDGPSLIPAGTMSLYRDVMQVKNDWLEQNNPLNNLPGARPEPGHEGDITPGGLIAGLTTGIAQQFTDPLMLAALGPTIGVGEAATGALSGAVSRIVGPQLAERLSPGAVSVLGTIAQKFSQGAIVGGLQNAMFEAEKKTSTPESVGQALVVGAGLGGVIDVGAGPVIAVVRRLGQVLLDNAPQISAALRSRQPAQAEANFAAGGIPGAIDRLRGPALGPEPTAGFRAPEVATPEPETPQGVNPFALHTEPGPGRVPLTEHDIATHVEDLATRYEANDARIQQLQDQLTNRGTGDYSGQIVRPSWAVGWSDDALRALAKREGLNPNDPAWGSRAQDAAYQSGLKGTGATQLSPTAARAEIARLSAENEQLLAATDVPEGSTTLYRGIPQTAADLPFAPYTAADDAAGTNPSSASQNPATASSSPGTPAQVRGAPGAAEPAALAELAQPELGGFRAPATTEAAPLPPERAPASPAATPTPTGRSPELDRLNAMFDGKKPAPSASVPDRLQAVGDSLTRMFTDRQVDINRAQERYAANLGRPLRGDEMAAELQRLASDPVAQVKVDEGLKPAIQSVGADYPALRNYVTLRSNIEVADNLATRTGKAEVATDRQFSGGLTRDESVKALQDLEQQLGPERFARVQAAADQVTAFNQSLRERLVKAGVLDEGTAAQLEAQYPNWAKTRILDYMADPAGGQGAGTKLGLSDRGLREYTLEGTTRAREDPIASTVAYAHQVERMAMKNEAFQAFLKIDQDSSSPMLREVPQSYTPKSNETTMIGFIDGQKQKYVTDNKALGAAINGASVLSTPEWTSAWQKIFRSLATSRNPLFLAGNAALDIPTYVLRSSVREGGPLALPRILGELARGYGDAFQGLFQGEFRGEGTSAFLKGGGGQSGFFTGGEGQSKQAVAEMQRKNVFQINGPQDMWRLTKDLLTLHPVEALGERIELGPRVAAMRLAERRGANATQAVIDGRTVTVDFSQGGTVTKYLNNFIPFFNVGFQGPAQIARAFRDNPRAFVATVGTLVGIPSAAAEVWNKSDPQRAKDYADVPQYVKDQGIVVMLPGEAPVDAQGNRKPMYAVIKLREWMPFATAAREATDRVLGDDSRSWQEMASSIGSGLSPIQAQSAAQVGTEPLGGIPILPAAAQLEMNTDFFRGRTIVTQRADQNASAVSKAITPAIQAIVDRAGINAEVRPSAIDFLVRNQGAGVGGAALSASDLAAGQPSDTAGATGTPVVGGLIGRFAGNQTGNELQQARDQTLTTEGRQTLRNNGITLTPGAVSGSVNQIPLNIEEETRYQQLTNRYIDAAIARTAASPDFARMTQVGKQSLMDQAMQAARSRAGIEVLNTIPADEKRRRLSTKSTAPAAA